MLNRLGHLFNRVNDVLIIFLIILLIYLTLSVSTTVLTRYLLNFMPRGIFETWKYSILYISFLGGAWLLIKDGHVRMDLVLTRLTPKAQRMLNTLTSVIGAGACFVLTWFSAHATLQCIQNSTRLVNEQLAPPQWPIMIIIPIGSFLIFIQFLVQSYRYGSGKQCVDEERD